jgi:hypothetical protein
MASSTILDEIKFKFEALVSLGDGWNEQKVWIYSDNTKMYYDLIVYDNFKDFRIDFAELASNARLKDLDHLSKADLDYFWKGVWTLEGSFGSVVYIELNTHKDVYNYARIQHPARKDKPPTKPKDVLAWLKAAINARMIPNGMVRNFS